MDLMIFVCLNNKQIRFVKRLMDLRLIKPVGAGGIKHPLTGKTEIMFQVYDTNKLFHRLFQWLFVKLYDKECFDRMQRMKACGALNYDEIPEDIKKEYEAGLIRV